MVKSFSKPNQKQEAQPKGEFIKEQKRIVKSKFLRNELIGKVPDDWLKLPLTRKQAMDNNLKFYFNGENVGRTTYPQNI